jgi:hypothetical protein
MEQNFSLFKEKQINFFKVANNNNLNYGMYVYGLTMSSYHNRSNEIEFNPIKDFVGKEWDQKLLRRIKWGATDETNIDEDFENYSIKFDKETEFIDTNEYLIKRAVELKRPNWSLFYLLGNIHGRLNYNKTKVKDYEIFTKDDFIRCLNYLSKDFLTAFQKDLIYLFNYFDERELQLSINLKNNEIELIDNNVFPK